MGILRVMGRRMGKAFYAVEVGSMLDLGRLACALERIPLPIVYLEVDGGVMGVQFTALDSVPLFYYAAASKVGHFLAYRNMEGREEVIAVDRMDNPTYLYAPVIFAAEPPPGFSLRSRGKARSRLFQPVQLRDLASLAKLSAYHMMYTEQVPPLYSFPSGSGWVLGVMLVPEDSSSGYFYYVPLERPPQEGFLKYDMHGGSTTAFTNKMTEHGFLFFKIIRLKERHPLIPLR
jgi:hypothetical protein